MKLEGPVHKLETIVLGNNVQVPVNFKMDWGFQVAQNSLFISVSTQYN